LGLAQGFLKLGGEFFDTHINPLTVRSVALQRGGSHTGIQVRIEKDARLFAPTLTHVKAGGVLGIRARIFDRASSMLPRHRGLRPCASARKSADV